MISYPTRAFIVMIAATAAGPQTKAQSQFDGAWSVTIVTRSGTCDQIYRISGLVSNGVIIYPGVSGRVAPSGAVSGTLSMGPIHASGSGRLSGNTGSGTWRGQGPNGPCSGSWNGQRN